ncbi:MAG: hypothetical protein EOO11_11260 [Chitinophagaceae bacterium]|nr:MAG: hypothetical protein EOO11_11260 [Chitinophagaceae bacterium]
MLRFLLIFCFLLGAAGAGAQLTGKQQAAAARYFHSLPVGAPLAEWVKGVAADTALVEETVPAHDSLTIYLGHGKRSPLVPEADSALIQIAERQTWGYRYGPGGEKERALYNRYYLLAQRYFVPKSAVTREAWIERCHRIVEEIAADRRARRSPHRYRNYWRTYSIGQRDTATDVVIHYGEHENRPYWCLILELRFSLAPAE